MSCSLCKFSFPPAQFWGDLGVTTHTVLLKNTSCSEAENFNHAVNGMVKISWFTIAFRLGCFCLSGADQQD